MTKRKHYYIALVDPDDHREGEVRFGGDFNEDENHWESGQLVFKWEQKVVPSGNPVPKRVQRIVDLANVALEVHWSDNKTPPANLVKKIIHKANHALHWYRNAHVAAWGEKPVHGQFARAFEEHRKFDGMLRKLQMIEEASPVSCKDFQAPDTLGKATGCTVCGFTESYHG